MGDHESFLKQILGIMMRSGATDQKMQQWRLKPADQFLEAGGTTMDAGTVGAFLSTAPRRWMASRLFHERHCGHIHRPSGSAAWLGYWWGMKCHGSQLPPRGELIRTASPSAWTNAR